MTAEAVAPADDLFRAAATHRAAKSPYLFPASHPRGHLSPHYVSTIVSRLLPEGYTMHKLRHRAGTVVYRKTGGDIYLAAKMLGHASVSTTAAYVAPNMANLRKALDD